ncbi:hypothetical protein BDR05DRAFT_1005244 [Suillus weaverae]|nr:hypothetical protein BDR05DRAFT_1005244 [Suillus weaverae]
MRSLISMEAVADLLKLSDETDLDILNHSMEAMVDRFKTELLEGLAQQNETIPDSIDVESLVTNGDDDKVYGAMGVAKTIGTVVSCIESSPEILSQVQEVIIPIIRFTLENKSIGPLSGLATNNVQHLDSATKALGRVPRASKSGLTHHFPSLHFINSPLRYASTLGRFYTDLRAFAFIFAPSEHAISCICIPRIQERPALRYQLRNQILHFKFNARALASLVTVACHALSNRFIVILGASVKVLEEDQEGDLRSAIDKAVRHLDVILPWISDAPKWHISSCNLFAVFCEESDLDSSLYRIDWVRQLVSFFDDQEISVHTVAWQAFDVSSKDELESLALIPSSNSFLALS